MLNQEDYTSHKVKNVTSIEINQATADTLIHIPCIGPVLSERIIKYRIKLGGFVSISQLNEVYGIDSLCYKKIEEYIYIDTSLVQWLNLNIADEQTIYMHPYLSKYQARAIIKFRELMGDFVDVKQLKENHILTESELSRVVKYLRLNSE